MRVIAGRLGGRQFNAPKNRQTHPMSDRIRGSLFNSLGDIKGLAVLDAFSGTGAFSYEAMSRGAQDVIAIEFDRSAIKTIETNIKALNLDNQIKLIKIKAEVWSNKSQNEQFDLILCDPPYDNPQIQTLQQLSNHTKQGGMIVFSVSSKTELILTSDFELLAEKVFGDATLRFYRRII